MSHTESDLIEAARELIELIDADTYPQMSLDKARVKRLRDLLHSAAKTVAGMADKAREREGRISRLESANGHLMVDRDRANSKAAEQVAAARELLVRHLGIDSPELDMRMREQVEHNRRSWALLDSERSRYDEFRTTMISLMHELVGRKSLDSEQLAQVRKIVDRANKKTLGW